MAVIVLSVDLSLLYLLEDPTDPSVVWTKLSNIFQNKSRANKLSLKKRLYNLKLRAGDSLQQHLKTFVETFAELAVVGDAVQDEDKVICLLASLPDDYATLVTALEASESVPTWETITERLLHHESKISRKSNADEENSLLLTKKKSTKKTFKCYECGKIGHLKKVCWKFLQKKSNSETSAASEKSSTEKCATAKGDKKIISLFATALPVISDDKNKWIIDS